MKNKFLRWLLTVVVTASLVGVQAAVTVKGVVVDGTGEPIIGANVLVKGSTTGTITDFDGNWQLEVESNSATLVFSYIGMQSKELSAQEANGATITLSEDTEVLEEVVVVGFGTQKKESLTGSVAVVGAQAFESKGSLSSPLEAMQGQVPGVIITRSSSAPGDEGWSMNLRGAVSMNSTEPLIIIDGVAAGSVNDMRNLNTNDIESINFLKDGAAAIYGSRAAGGVVLITTKRGAEGRVKVEYSGSLTTKLLGLQPTLMNNMQWAEGVMQTLENDKNTGHVWYTYAQLAQLYNGRYIDLSTSANPFGTAAFTDVADFVFSNTDWLGGLFGTGYSTQHNLSISGGSEKNTFRVSLAYNYDGSNLKYGNNNNNRLNFRVNDTYHFTKNISLTSQFAFSRQEQVVPTEIGSALTTSMPMPGLPMAALNGRPYAWGTWGSPVAKVEEGGDNRLSVNNFSLNETFAYKITDWLDMNVNFGYTNNSAQRNTASYAIQYYNITGERPTLLGPTQENSYYNQTQSRKDFISASGYFNAHKTFSGVHNTSLTVGAQYEYEQYNYFGVRAKDVQRGIKTVNGAGDVTISQSSMYKYAIASVFARANYDYKGRYLIEGNYRLDGSSKFLPENRWSSFGGVSVGWRMSEEEWMKTSWLSNLKLRYSYAQVGNQSGIGYYDGVQLYNMVSNSGAYIGDGLLSYIATNGTFASRERTWERISNYNAAIDFGFSFGKHNITGTVEAFHKQNNNMLVSVKKPATLGDNAPSANVGKFRDYGVDGQLSYDGKTGDWSYGVGGSITWARNQLVEYEGTSVRTSGYTSTQVGYGLNSLFGMRYGGKIQNEEQLQAYLGLYYPDNGIGMPNNLRVGDNMFYDENGDGKLDENDYIYLGSDDPEISYSFNVHAGWKDIISLSIVFQGAGNRFVCRSAYDMNNWVVPFRGIYMNSTTSSIGNTWSPERPDAYYTPYTMDNNINVYNYQASSLTAQSGNYIRLKEVSLRLNMPKKWLGTQKAVTGFGIYVTANDLWEHTKITDGFDPEAKLSKGGTAFYPFTRNVTVGANLTF
ncbi:MAG: SusC/RagA family TonB-linked outer membrane protein [Paludibacteraceae bacterium]|nr:SusC/RagA family TonB-linked outer membrane protein [Paludibacteraceae bacterium]